MTSTPRRRRFGRLADSRDDSGAVAVLVALLLPILLICVAFAVDVSRWYLELQRLQRTADAASLAAAPLMPNSLTQRTTPPYVAALDTVERNGYSRDSATAFAVAGNPTQVRVRVENNVSNIFAAFVGWGSIRLAREAVADFTGPIAMGSPCNVFGNELMEASPKGSAACPSEVDNAGYWMNIAGPRTNKARGDGFASSWCTRPDTEVPNTWDPDTSLIDRCSAYWGDRSTAASTPPKDNLDWAGFPGYVYKVRVKQGGTLNLEGYDMGWVATGDNCTEGNLVSDTPTELRYKRGSNPYCSGDTQMSLPEGDQTASNGTGATAVTTTVTVRDQSDNPYDPLAGKVICSLEFPGYKRDTPLASLTSDAKLNSTFHKWANIMDGSLGTVKEGSCTGAFAVTPGDYSIQIQTYTGGTPAGGGQNRFALRAYLASGSPRDVSMFAVDRVSFFNNVKKGTSYFNLVRLDSSAAAHTLRIRFYDLGDATRPVTAKVLQPDSATFPPSATASNPALPFNAVTGIKCKGKGPVTSADLPNCAVTTQASTNGGRWQTIEIDVPRDYQCTDDNDQAKCWVRIQLTTDDAQADTTTWSAELLW